MLHLLINDGKPGPRGHALISALILTLAASLYGFSFFSIQRLSTQWQVCTTSEPDPHSHDGKTTAASSSAVGPPPPLLEELRQKPLPELRHVFAMIDTLGSDPLQTTPPAAVNSSTLVSKEQKERLQTQLIKFQRAQQTACEIGVFFFAHRNATLTVATAAAIISLGLLAIVSKEGWSQTNNRIINIGLTSGLVLITAITFSQLYGQGSNFENQKAKVILATNVLNSVASAVANRSDRDLVTDSDASGNSKPRTISLGKPEDLAAMIHALDRQLEVLVNLDFSGDSSFAEQSAKRISDMLTGPGKSAQPKP